MDKGSAKKNIKFFYLKKTMFITENRFSAISLFKGIFSPRNIVLHMHVTVAIPTNLGTTTALKRSQEC